MISKTSDNHLQHVGLFLTDYVVWLWGCGATCTRIEKNVSRIARAYGLSADLTLLPRHATIHLTGQSCPLEGEIFTCRLRPCAINFDLNSRLSTLSWNIADTRMDIHDARCRFNHIISRKYHSSASTLLLVALANASFCRLFGGDAIAMAIVFTSTLAGFYLKTLLVRTHLDSRIVFFVCAMLSSTLCAGATLFDLGTTPGIALATSVLYLIPGVPYINSASDLIARHYLCAFSRFTDALILTACLSLGLCAGLAIMHLKLI